VSRRDLYRISRFLMRSARGDVENSLLSNGEEIVQRIALRSASSVATVFDVGANVGDWTAGLTEESDRLQMPVRVFAYEPCRATFDRLSNRFRERAETVAINAACSRKPGNASMHIFGNGAGTNSLVEPIDGLSGNREEVRLTTIDLECASRGIDKIDLLKIDAEGHDFDVMVGACEMLDAHRVRFVQFEYNQRWIGARNYLRDVFSFLNPKGYVVGKLCGTWVEFYPSWQWELETYVEGNYVACSEGDKQRFNTRVPSWLLFSRDNS
jgi:FkbM family methyltransferase